MKDASDLMLAAPDLLAAAKAALQDLTEALEEMGYGPADLDDDDTLCMLRAAIAKATGGAS